MTAHDDIPRQCPATIAKTVAFAHIQYTYFNRFITKQAACTYPPDCMASHTAASSPAAHASCNHTYMLLRNLQCVLVNTCIIYGFQASPRLAGLRLCSAPFLPRSYLCNTISFAIWVALLAFVLVYVLTGDNDEGRGTSLHGPSIKIIARRGGPAQHAALHAARAAR